MENRFAPYEESLAMKEMGFDESCMGYYYGGNPVKFTYTEKIKNKKCLARKKMSSKGGNTVYLCTAPLWQDAFDWFEKTYGLYLNRVVNCSVNEVLGFSYFFTSIYGTYEVDFVLPYDEFDRNKARLACLQKLIEIVKLGKNGK
jgi:hypothetical protein